MLVIEPFRSRLATDGTGVRVANFLDEVLKTEIMAFWIAERKWAGRNMAASRQNSMEAVQEGVVFLKSNEADARAGLSKKYLRVDAKDLPSYEARVPV